MGAVYLATQHGGAGFRRLVAVKRALPHYSGDPHLRRLLAKEARVASLVRHPNVVSLIDVEESDGEIAIIMEYVEGASLAEIPNKRREIPLRTIARIFVDAADGLQAIHECRDERGKPLGLVHRDISPQNILVGLDGVSRLTDFGIAQAQDSATAKSGILRGKPAYMAPEYIEAGVAIPASDVFALGIVLWEALTGYRLFKGATDIKTIDQARAANVCMPSLLRGGISIQLDRLVLKALARSPKDRFASAAELSAALEEAFRERSLAGERIAVRRLVESVAGEAIAARKRLPDDEVTRSVAELPRRPPPTTGAGVVIAEPPPSTTQSVTLSRVRAAGPTVAAAFGIVLLLFLTFLIRVYGGPPAGDGAGQPPPAASDNLPPQRTRVHASTKEQR